MYSLISLLEREKRFSHRYCHDSPVKLQLDTVFFLFTLHFSVNMITNFVSSTWNGIAGAGGCSDGQGSSSKDGGNVEKDAASGTHIWTFFG
jgi:hypothetical protein